MIRGKKTSEERLIQNQGFKCFEVVMSPAGPPLVQSQHVRHDARVHSSTTISINTITPCNRISSLTCFGSPEASKPRGLRV